MAEPMGPESLDPHAIAGPDTGVERRATTAGSSDIRPRVLQLVPALGDGGVERGAVEMAGYLSERGLDNWIASAGGPLLENAKALGARHADIAVGRKSPLAIIASAIKVAKLVDAEGIDIIHARSRAPAWAGLLAKRLARRKVHFTTTFHGLYGSSNALKRFYNSGMLRAPVVIANSRFIRQHIIDVYGYPDDRIVVAARGVALDMFDPETISAEQRATVRQELGGVPDRPLVVMVGRVTGWKGHAVLLDAFARCGHPEARLALVGSGVTSVMEDVRARIERLGLTDRVRMVGSRRDIPAVLAAADLAVSASTTAEAFGRAAIEAQAMRVPVVATAHGGSLETVLPGETGWLVPSGDADAMAAAIREALDDPARLADMGRAGRAHMLANFTTKAMLDQEFEAYRRLLAGAE